MGSSERGHGAGTARAAIAIQVEGSIGMGTRKASTTGRGGWRWGKNGSQFLAARDLPGPPTSTHPGLALTVPPRPARSATLGPEVPSGGPRLPSFSPPAGRRRVPRAQSQAGSDGLGQGAAPSWPRGSAPRWLPCQPSARESGAAGDPERRQRLLARARPPARGGVCRRSPPLPSLRRGPPRTDCAPRPPPLRTATPRAATGPWHP